MTTGPMKVPEEMMEDWYQRLVNVAIPLKRRGLGLACHPKDHAFMRDMLERLMEDERWKFDEPMVLVVHSAIQQGTFQPVKDADTTAKILTMTQAMKARRGLGRFTGISLPNNGEISDPFREKRR